MIVRSREWRGEEPTPPRLRGCVQEFLSGCPRLDQLYAYYDGRHAIAGSNRAAGMPNHRLTHGFPRYISTVASGYLVGSPIHYESDDRAALEPILDAFASCAIDSVDAELARHASIFGRGVEQIFADENARPRSAALDPRRAFVVYDDSVEHRPLFGVHLTPRLDDAGAEAGQLVRVCTDTEQLIFAGSGFGDVGPLKRRERHYFGGIPMIEYWNDESERGDFEGVLSLIDAYDRLQSDRMNDKQQFVDALLLLYGCTMEPDERGRTPGEQLREDKVLALPDSDARAEWLCKQLNEADTEVLKSAIAADIHKLSMVPDLSDAHFAQNLSGVAMRYKLMGLEQLTRIKERWFREGLRQRLARYGDFLAVRGASRTDADGVRILFRRSLPVDTLERVEALNGLRGLVPDEELVRRAEQIEG